MKSFSKDKQPAKHHYKLQQEIATEAARLLCEEGIDDIHKASQRAAQKLGLYGKHFLPTESEVLFQVKIHQSLYQNSSNKKRLKNLLQTAFNAMTLMNSFKPQLIGPVLQGYAHEHSPIEILLQVDTPEEIAVFLMAQNIPYQLDEWKLYSGKPKSSSKSKVKNSFQLVPNYQFFAGRHQINLIILTEKNRKMIPLEPENWQAIQSASLTQVATLLEQY